MYENGRGDENKQLGTLENMNHLFDEGIGVTALYQIVMFSLSFFI